MAQESERMVSIPCSAPAGPQERAHTPVPRGRPSHAAALPSPPGPSGGPLCSACPSPVPFLSWPPPAHPSALAHASPPPRGPPSSQSVAVPSWVPRHRSHCCYLFGLSPHRTLSPGRRHSPEHTQAPCDSWHRGPANGHPARPSGGVGPGESRRRESGVGLPVPESTSAVVPHRHAPPVPPCCPEAAGLLPCFPSCSVAHAPPPSLTMAGTTAGRTRPCAMLGFGD